MQGPKEQSIPLESHLWPQNNCLKVEQSVSTSEVISHRYLGDALSRMETNTLTRKIRFASSKTLQTWFTCKLSFMSPAFL